MNVIEQARKVYIEYQLHKHFLQQSKKIKMKRDIQQFLIVAINQVPSKDLFANTWLLDILKSALTQRIHENPNVEHVERAFKGLEKYFLLLVQQPWKTEFREIKMYGGFYRSMIKSVIPDCEHIFERAGYMVSPKNCAMVYRGPLDKTFLLLLALDCRVSQMECRVIAEHYNMVKGFPVALNAVISNVLCDEYPWGRSAFRYSLYQKYSLTEDASVNSIAVAPPAVPQREPIINGSAMRQNGKLENKAYGVSGHPKLKLAETKLNTGSALPPRPLNWTLGMNSTVSPKPPLISTDVIPGSFGYIEDNTIDEIIPELPQGTCEDHMRETLKLVNQQDISRQKTSEDLRWAIKNISSLNHSTASPSFVSGPNSGNLIMQSNSKPGSSVDEGIDPDMSSSKSFSLSSKFSSIGSQQVLSNKHHTNLQQSSVESGYHTGNPESIYSRVSTNLMHHLQQPIYHPPNIATDNTGPTSHRKVSLSRQNALPPQIPSRALKPTHNTEDDSLYMKIYMSSIPYTTSQLAAVKTPTQSESMAAQPTLSAPGFLTVPKMSEMKHILHRPVVYKSSSLKTDGPSIPLSQQIATARMARSMDMTYWECSACCKLNTSSNTICSFCSQSYLAPDVNQSEYNKTQTMF